MRFQGENEAQKWLKRLECESTEQTERSGHNQRNEELPCCRSAELSRWCSGQEPVIQQLLLTSWSIWRAFSSANIYLGKQNPQQQVKHGDLACMTAADQQISLARMPDWSSTTCGSAHWRIHHYLYLAWRGVSSFVVSWACMQRWQGWARTFGPLAQLSRCVSCHLNRGSNTAFIL